MSKILLSTTTGVACDEKSHHPWIARELPQTLIGFLKVILMKWPLLIDLHLMIKMIKQIIAPLNNAYE